MSAVSEKGWSALQRHEEDASMPSVMVDAAQFHEDLAEEWELKYQRPTFKNRLHALLSLLCGNGPATGKWLDAGCGTGILSRRLAERGCDVIGVDASPKMIEVAKRLGRSGPVADKLGFHVIETIEKLDLPESTFDGIVCSSVVEYIDNPSQAVSEFARLLKPGGLLLISVPNRLSLLRLVERALNLGLTKLNRNPWLPYCTMSKNEYSFGSLESLLGSKGFRVKYFIYFWPLWPRWMGRTKLGGSLIIVLAEKL